MQCIQRLCEYTNVIPLIAKADLLSPSEIASLKHSFSGNRRPFLFGDSFAFAVSSAKSNDDDNMDASVLMSPDYVQPLIRSELDLLVAKLFDRDNLAWMRHSTAKKLAQVQPELPLPRAVQLFNNNNNNNNNNNSNNNNNNGYEQISHVRLASWAEDLQRSLQNERERYSALARGRLTDIEQCSSSSLVRRPFNNGSSSSLSSSSSSYSSSLDVYKANMPTIISPQDPLGVVYWTDDLRRRGWATTIGFGIVGGLALLFNANFNAKISPSSGPSSAAVPAGVGVRHHGLLIIGVVLLLVLLGVF